MTIKQKNLIWTVGFLLLFGVCLMVWVWQSGNGGRTAVIMQNGIELYRFALDQQRTVTIQEENGGENVVIISPEGVCISEANCPDGLCVKQGTVTRPGIPIVCLPNRLVVVIEGGPEDETQS